MHVISVATRLALVAVLAGTFAAPAHAGVGARTKPSAKNGLSLRSRVVLATIATAGLVATGIGGSAIHEELNPTWKAEPTAVIAGARSKVFVERRTSMFANGELRLRLTGPFGSAVVIPLQGNDRSHSDARLVSATFSPDGKRLTYAIDRMSGSMPVTTTFEVRRGPDGKWGNSEPQTELVGPIRTPAP